MKKGYRVFAIYLSFSALIAVLGYVFDGTLGIWRQTLVGGALLLTGLLVAGKQGRVERINGQGGKSALLSSSVVLAFGILLAISLRLMFAKIAPPNTLAHSDVKFIWRFVATALVPSLCVWTLGKVLNSVSPKTGKVAMILISGLSMMPFCTDWQFLPAAFVLGAVIGACDLIRSGVRFANIFVSYLILLFYDTLSISIGSIDFNLTLKMVFSFFLISLSLGVLFVYLALRPIRERKFHIAEFLTILLICAILLLVAIAL